MTTLQVLKKARALVRKGWCQHGAAQTAQGLATSYASSSAAKFCVMGAVWKATPRGSLHEAAFRALAPGAADDYLIDWNDDRRRRKSDVIARFDRAIKRLEKCRAS